MNAAQLHRLARRLREVALATSGDGDEEHISAGELAIVEDVARHPGTSIGGISRRTRLAQSLVSRTVSAMRDAGVFTTEPDPADRRKLLVDIDSETRLRLFRDRGSRPIEEELLGALPGIEPGEFERVVSMLEEVAGIRLDESAREAVETVGGLVMAVLGRMARQGDEITVAGRTIRVERLDGRRVDRVRLLAPGARPPEG